MTVLEQSSYLRNGCTKLEEHISFITVPIASDTRLTPGGLAQTSTIGYFAFGVGISDRRDAGTGLEREFEKSQSQKQPLCAIY